MIEPYWGELLVNPVPLELSLNWCSHACAFCFANLNQPDRTADVKKIFRFLADYQNRETLAAHLLREGRPLLMSNKVDPFAHSNYQQTLPILETLGHLGIPVAFQTRGGRGIDEALTLVGPSCWYVSVNTLDEERRRALEPGAPTIASRFELMARLRGLGHRVVMGLNPLVPEWMPEPEAALDQALAAGVEGVWVEHLHLNPKQIGRLTAKERANLTEPLIKRAQKRRPPEDVMEHIHRTTAAAMDRGLPVYSIGQPYRSDFFEPYHQTYKHTFPTFQGFVNKMHDEPTATSRLITFDEWADYFCPSLPEGVLGIDSYLGATAHDLWHKAHVPPRMTYRQLLGIAWSEPKTHQCPAKYPSFAYAAVPGDDGAPVQLVDENQMPLLCFSPDGFEDFYAFVEVN